jgi:predicted HAD superfamily Cof-like phosphohydrolase
MQHPYDAVVEFHRAFGLTENSKPTLPSDDVRTLRKKLLEEEFIEYNVGEDKNDIVEIADALADLIYISFGTAVAYGFPLE